MVKENQNTFRKSMNNFKSMLDTMISMDNGTLFTLLTNFYLEKKTFYRNFRNHGHCVAGCIRLPARKASQTKSPFKNEDNQ